MDAARVPNPIFDDLSALADATRSRMLLLLERHELTVSELCAVLQLPQSTVSRHLKTLADADWVASRREGTSRYYTMALDDASHATRRLWSLLREQVSADGRRRPGRAAAAGRAGAAPDQVAGVLRVGGRAVGPAARGAVRAQRRHLQALPGAARRALGRRRSGLRHRPGQRGARAVRRARDRRRRVRRDAAGGATAAARRRRTSSCAAASSRRCRSTTASSMPRRCCWCCTTCRTRRPRWPKPRAC